LTSKEIKYHGSYCSSRFFKEYTVGKRSYNNGF
jgi:hypothetical protein